ncbi:SH3 domain-containing protein [Thioclava sp.]|uniref:SH3 domain-containing protein n=1 Tax=Thioclava sp. TaxID=1933450 RepID=UPI003AA955DA
MGKLLFTTLAGIFVSLTIFGRDLPGDSATVETDAAPQVTRSASNPDPLYAPNKITASTAPQVVPASATVSPVIAKARMPGPALRPSPEYRSIEAPQVAGGSLWTVSANALNVRSGPSTANSAVDRIRKGEQVLVMSQQSGWAHIKIEGDGIDGWVAARFLTPAN